MNSSDDPSWLYIRQRAVGMLQCWRSLSVGGIDEIASGVVVRIKQFEGRLFVHAAHTKLRPLVADAHRTYEN